MSYQALLFCPDDKTARVVTQVLTELDFAVEPCNEPFAAVKKLMAQHFDAIVVDCDNEQNAALLFKSARNSESNQNSLAVAVVEGQAGVAKAFRIGANLVLTKPINVEQSKGTLRVARGLLRKVDSGKPSGAVATEPKPQPVPAVPEAPRTAALPAQKPLAAAFTTPRPAAPPPAPVARESGFEREADPELKPEPAEAALLESMPDPTPPAKPLASASTPKEYPWQPVSKLAEPMASALRIAAETAAKSSAADSDTAKELPQWGSSSEPAQETRPFSGSAISSLQQGIGQAAGTATAPAKEDLKPAAQSVEFTESTPAPREIKPEPTSRKESVIPMEVPQIEPPTFAALAVKDHEEGEAEGRGKKAYVIIALVVLATIFTAYVAYQKTSATGGQAGTPPAVRSTSTVAPGAATTGLAKYNCLRRAAGDYAVNAQIFGVIS